MRKREKNRPTNKTKISFTHYDNKEKSLLSCVPLNKRKKNTGMRICFSQKGFITGLTKYRNGKMDYSTIYSPEGLGFQYYLLSLRKQNKNFL
jgi:hypothetical protein